MALLKGVPEEELFDAVLAGRSMYLMFSKYKVLCSSIVGGILPIALGVAVGIKRKGGDEKANVFIGDMCARTGLFHEFIQYADGFKLPIRVIVEDNGLSTDTPTIEVWGSDVQSRSSNIETIRYNYQRTEPHVGVGVNVAF